MKKQCISADWFFAQNDNKGRKGEYVKIDLPHDYAISNPRRKDAPGGAANGYFCSNTAKYNKYMKFEKNEHVILDIDGAYMCSEIFMNDDLLAIHPHGYTPFLVDITDKIRLNRTNKISVITTDMQPSTRWYSGAGVYRDVFLWTGGAVRIEPWSLFVKTVSISEKLAKINIVAEVTSDITDNVKIEFVIKDELEKDVKYYAADINVCKDDKTKLDIIIELDNPMLWDTENPYLYNIKTTISKDKEIYDTAKNTFGIRTIGATSKDGFKLNGRSMKLKGGCIHHDHGGLGAAAFYEAEKRKVKLLKQAGFNALRIAHNPPSLAMLEICDREGIILIDEAFDMWVERKTNCDYHLWFMDWWARDISYMVMRDRNHPCVIAYSIGNEIKECTDISDGCAWAEKLSAEIRKYDDTRFVTSGVCGVGDFSESCDPEDYIKDSLNGYDNIDADKGAVTSSWGPRTEQYMEPLDIVGYNYLFERYENDKKVYPKRVIWGSETHAIHFFDSWNAVLNNDNVIGDFTWTAYDNLGEAGTGRFEWEHDGVINGISLADYPWRSCYQGDFDLCGYRRPQSYFRQAIWSDKTEPMIFTTHPKHNNEGFSGTGWHWYDVSNTWTFDEKYISKPVKTEVYSTADEIVFILNGDEVARCKPQKAVASVYIPYQKGILSAQAFKNGKMISTSSVTTADEKYKINVIPEKTSIISDNHDLCYIDISITDKNGNRIPDAEDELTCIVDGGELMCIFSANPKNEDNYTTNKCHAFEGRAVAVVRTKDSGKVNVIIGAEKLLSGSVGIMAK